MVTTKVTVGRTRVTPLIVVTILVGVLGCSVKRSGGLLCSVHGLEAFGRVVVQCPRPRRLSLDKDDVGNL
ncbi:unnamed protein product [Spirodela intermedia]|uniref:Uncharacterized protein n=1 Tax=Spirodela intermedia TaxID=51605 RepID=A0A7I8KXQ8_SPIIN|nr:unnamed protein product [Spirodela intermedia]